MRIRYKDLGGIRLYVLENNTQGRDTALKLCRVYGYHFYPEAQAPERFITTECYSGYLTKKEKIREPSVCTVSKVVYTSLDLPYEDVALPENAGACANRTLKDLKNRIKDSRVVFIGGRGMGSKANYIRLKKLADRFGAHIGCSRPVAMNGWESYDNFVGISGNILEADVVVTFGVSGAGPFIKGIENCRTVIAVNNDKNALIFKQADYGILDDCMNVISYLERD